MADLSHLYMDGSKIEEVIAKIDADVAKKLLERMCKALSIAYNSLKFAESIKYFFSFKHMM